MVGALSKANLNLQGRFRALNMFAVESNLALSAVCVYALAKLCRIFLYEELSCGSVVVKTVMGDFERRWILSQP